jgi:hypothetical protein
MTRFRTTPSYDGERRIDLSLGTVRMSRYDFVNTLALAYRQEAVDEDELPTLKFRDALRRIRETLRNHGMESTYWWADELDEEDVARIRDWAGGEVARLFPEFTSK